MSKENNINSLSEAMVAFQKKLKPIEKVNEVKFGTTKFKYADLGTIQSVVNPILSDVDLECYFSIKPIDNANILLSCNLTYAPTKETRTNEIIIGESIERAPQKFGGLITYAKRYLLASLLNVIICDDLDVDAMAPDIWQKQNMNSKINVEVTKRNKANYNNNNTNNANNTNSINHQDKEKQKINENIVNENIVNQYIENTLNQLEEAILDANFTELVHNVQKFAYSNGLNKTQRDTLLIEINNKATKQYGYVFNKELNKYEPKKDITNQDVEF